MTDYTAKIHGGRRDQVEFRKNGMMILGALLVGLGMMFLPLGFLVGLDGAIIDSGACTSPVCAGSYVIRRFARQRGESGFALQVRSVMK